MKKILGSFMALVMLLGCSSQSQETQNSDTQNQTAVAQNGDYVNIDFVGKIDGVAFNGGSAKGYELKLGSDTMIDGFEDGIVGMKLDEEKTITATFPENYMTAPDLAGKEATFDITLHKIYREIQ